MATAPTVLSAEKSLIESIEKSGGLILPWPGEANSWEVEFHLRGRELTDDGLAKVASLKSVIALNLRDTQITSAGLIHLKALSKLKRLHLERTKIDDSGMNHLAGLQNLEYLNLYGTKITDKALSTYHANAAAGETCTYAVDARHQIPQSFSHQDDYQLQLDKSGFFIFTVWYHLLWFWLSCLACVKFMMS